MSDDTRDDADVISLADKLNPPPEPEPTKLFTVVERGGYLSLLDRETMAGVRPCEHRSYILDDEWSTVTCGECKAKLDPYAVLRQHAKIWQKIRSERAHYIRAHVDLLRASCHDMLRRSCFDDAERKRLKSRLYTSYGQDTKTLDAIIVLHKELEARVDAAHDARMAKRARNAQASRDAEGADVASITRERRHRGID